MKTKFGLAACFSLCASALMAAPEIYDLNFDTSTVGFSYMLGGQPTKGQMPVKTADLVIDVTDISASVIDVVLSSDEARAGLFVATQAMRSKDVLAPRHYPEIRFQSRDIVGSIHGAKVTGDLTLRGVTRQVMLDAQLFRQAGHEAGDLDHLSVLLTGKLDRHVFGASGYSELVGPQIDLRILVRMERRGL